MTITFSSRPARHRAGKFVIMVGNRFFCGPGTSSNEAHAAIYSNRAVAERALEGAGKNWFTAGEFASARVAPLSIHVTPAWITAIAAQIAGVPFEEFAVGAEQETNG